jgi:F-type H+-transporting ATPase subunit gamma
MPSLKDIRKRIASVRSTQQITKAMKMVAAAKLRRAQEEVEGARPYAQKLAELLDTLSGRVEGASHPLLAEGSSAPAHVVVLTSDRGLCGGYNSNLIKLIEEFLASDAGRDATVTVCGRRGRDHLKPRVGHRLVAAHVNRPGGMDLELAREVTADASCRYQTREAGSVYLVYSRFHSAISQKPVIERLLPIAEAAEAGDPDKREREQTDYVYEPSAAVLLESLVPRYIETRVYQAMLDAVASEHGARMTAMDSATRNASEMIDRLTLEMNRARQAMITTELMEIVGGAEALKG